MSGNAAASAADELTKQQRKADGRKTLPTVQPWTCSFKHRLLPSTQASLKMLLRELKAYLKVDAIRETAYLTDEHEKTEARTIRNSVLMWTERQTLVPGTEVHATTGAVRICRHGNGNVIQAERVRHDHFMDANGTMVRIILGAVKDPAIVNQLSDLHDAQEGKFARTAIMMVELLRKKFDSDDFVHRFLHLIDFIEFEQPRTMATLDFIEDYQRRMDRLKAAYTKDGAFDNVGMNKDLFVVMFYAKVDKSIRKMLPTHISTL